MSYLRGMAILMVIAFHSATILERHGYLIPSVLQDLNQLFVLYRMPTLVFLSGCLLAGSFGKGVTLYLVGKGRRILWPLLVMSNSKTKASLPSPKPLQATTRAGEGVEVLAMAYEGS